MLSYYFLVSSASCKSKNNLIALPTPPANTSKETAKMGRLHISGNSEDSTSFKPLFTSQALALHDGMGGPHPSTTQIVQPVSVFGEITDMPRRNTLSARSSSGISPLSLRESNSSSASSSGAPTPLQCSTTPSSGHAQAQGLHMGMAWAQSHRTQPVSLLIPFI